jgi:hypothetical protein
MTMANDQHNNPSGKIGKSSFEAVIAALGEGISIQDTSYRVLYQNQIHRSLAGGDKTGQFCYAAYRGQTAVCDRCPVAESFKDGAVHRIERARNTPDGERHVEIVSSPIRDAGGAIVAAVELVRDITQRRAAEIARENLIRELQQALENIKTLRGLLPICASCKRIRDDKGYWNKIEAYISQHTDVDFSHGLCPDCIRNLYPEYNDTDNKS